MIEVRLAGVILLSGLALGYLFRKWVGEWKPAPEPEPKPAQEWTGEVAGFPNAYNVRVRPD